MVLLFSVSGFPYEWDWESIYELQENGTWDKWWKEWEKNILSGKFKSWNLLTRTVYVSDESGKHTKATTCGFYWYGNDEASKTVLDYSKADRRKRTIYTKKFPHEYHWSDIDSLEADGTWSKWQKEWHKSVFDNTASKDWELTETIIYALDGSGKITGTIGDNGEIEHSYYYTLGKTDYSDEGELLFKDYKFQCTFDKHGNWTSVIKRGCVEEWAPFSPYQSTTGGGFCDEEKEYFHLIKRKIEYYE
ncbi:MAG: hypothetical protein FWG84_07575 [Bacteroidales bacterium]|nr:hypothetical protein [Bacteroidales bacterium]